jgi:hypothetical protein
MNAAMKPLFRLVDSHVPPERSPPPPQRITRQPVQLQPIPWGQPDPDLARAVCWHIRDAMPDTVIPFNPVTHRKLRTYLREHGFTH